ncbi:MAG: FMN-dependent NADH-azoreductase [Acidobacteriaceae bacterium]|nr:FMN-dependent NADH-azoreductase [Acidobacteriaceae bacterium]
MVPAALLKEPAFSSGLGKLPHLDQATLKAITTQDPVEAESLKEVVYLPDQLIDELLLSELLVIACPMWNFGIPSSLKAWIDHVVRAGRPSTTPESQ